MSERIIETCIACDCPTGNAGINDGSLYATDGRGPFCEQCWYIAGYCLEAPDDELIHCEHWWDGEQCCFCGDPAMTDEEIERKG